MKWALLKSCHPDNRMRFRAGSHILLFLIPTVRDYQNLGRLQLKEADSLWSVESPGSEALRKSPQLWIFHCLDSNMKGSWKIF